MITDNCLSLVSGYFCERKILVQLEDAALGVLHQMKGVPLYLLYMIGEVNSSSFSTSSYIS